MASPFDCGARLFGANSEVRRPQRRCEAAPRAAARSYPSLPSRRSSPPQTNRQQSSIHSSPFRRRNASVRRDQERKKSLKLPDRRKKAANSGEFAAISAAHRPLGSETLVPVRLADQPLSAPRDPGRPPPPKAAAQQPRPPPMRSGSAGERGRGRALRPSGKQAQFRGRSSPNSGSRPSP
jgi:hypothetical protein